MNVYLLNSQQVSELLALNTLNVCIVPCDHGSGACIGEFDLDAPEFSSHKALLDSWGLSLTAIAINGGI